FAFRECGLDLTLHIATSGPEAVAFLKQQNQFSKDLNVALILMDWHLPVDMGAQTLIAIRDLQRKLKLLPIPIIVFSSSLLLADVRDAYAEGANCGSTKGVTWTSFSRQSPESYDFGSKPSVFPLRRHNSLPGSPI
ncbi:MAG TPA: hypothetical protein VKU01_36845, partial [Bryobacteraceae bacterium]|nr:hypothetical protein [Bryobacteraceae bacterium]